MTGRPARSLKIPSNAALPRAPAEGWRVLSAALVEYASHSPDWIQPTSKRPLLSAVAIGVVGYGVSLMLFITALRFLGSARTGAYFAVVALLFLLHRAGQVRTQE